MSNQPNQPDSLRAGAEAKLTHLPKPKPYAAEELLHELQVHQIELEMQNENSNGLIRQYFPKGMDLTDVRRRK